MKQVRELSGCRRRCKLSQEAVAEKLGVSRQTLSRWERGETEIPAQYLPKLAELYGVSVNELLEELYGMTDAAGVAASTETPEKPAEQTEVTLTPTSQKLPLRYKIALCSAVALCVLLVGILIVTCTNRSKQHGAGQGTHVSQDNMQTDHIDPGDGSNFDMEWPDD